MSKLLGDTHVEDVARKYRVSDRFAERLRVAVEDARAHPERAQRVYDLIRSLPGKTPKEQQSIVAEIQALLGQG